MAATSVGGGSNSNANASGSSSSSANNSSSAGAGGGSGGQAQAQSQSQSQSQTPSHSQSQSADKWYFSRDQLSASPSRRCGVDADKELAYRQQAANLIQDMGQRLQVSQLCINTAIVYMHRFYAFHSFTQFHRNSMAAAALFLAAKVEEQPRKLEHVIKVAHICLHRGDSQSSLDTQSKHYLDQAQDLVFNENVLLQTLGFDVAIDHPHTHVVRLCNLVTASKDLAQTSYFMASNSLHLTTMCLQYRPTVVACFCIHLASKWSNWAIPQSNEGKHWFYYVDRTVTSELLEHLTSEFLHIFDRCPARLKKKIMSISNTQGTNSPQQPGSSHSSNSVASAFDKESRKLCLEELEKTETDKRQQSLFGPSIPSNSNQMGSVSSKMDYREYKERQQQQDRRRPSNLPPSNLIPRPNPDMSGSSQLRQSSSSGQRPQTQPPSQHRWPSSNHRSKDMVSMRPHPYQSSSSSSTSSSRPPHRSSVPAHPSQISASQSMQPMPEQKSRSQHPPHQALLHSSRIHSQPQIPPQQIMQQQQQQQQPSSQQSAQHQSHQPVPSQPPQLNIQMTVPQPTHRPPSLFSPEPQRKPSAPRRLPMKETILPTALSPISSSPPSISQAPLEVEPTIVKKVEEPPMPEIQMVPPLATNSVETDPTLVSSLLKESLPHKADKKKKKDKHKHKDREKREERRKHKKDKDKKRESELNFANTARRNLETTTSTVLPNPPSQNSTQAVATPIKITIPREAIVNTTQPPSTKLKIKIAKERLRAEPPVPAPPPTQAALKIKIPKELVENSRKRPSPMMMMDVPPHKVPRPPQQSHQQHKVSQEFQQRAPTGYSAPPPPLMMMYHHQIPPPVVMYQHHPPPYFYQQPNVYPHPPPASSAPPLPPLPPPPPPPPPP